MHIDDVNYTKASVGVAVADSPTGPCQYLYSKRRHGYDSRDITVFKDDDGKVYLIYSSEDNSKLHIGPLTDDYLDFTRVVWRFLVGQHREAPAFSMHWMGSKTGTCPRSRVENGSMGDDEESLCFCCGLGCQFIEIGDGGFQRGGEELVIHK